MRWEVLTTCLLLTGSAWLGLVQACGTTTTPATNASLDAGPVCLTNVQQQNGTACEAPDGYSCPVPFLCTDPPLKQLANCVCASGNWQCSYAATVLDGAAIVPDATPTCVPGGSGDQAACPASVVEAIRGGPEGGPLGCAIANAGLSCSYDSGVTCPDASFPGIATCQCVGGPDGGLVFDCEPVVCDVVPPDAMPDSPIERAPDARQDSATDGD